MRHLASVASTVLRDMYEPSSGLFSLTTSVVDGGYRSIFHPRHSLRYSAISLAGLARAEKTGHAPGWEVRSSIDLFLDRHRSAIESGGDEGLLLWALAENDHPAAEQQAKRVITVAEETMRGSRALELQEVCWLLSGLSIHARSRLDDAARATAERLFGFLLERYLPRTEGFPRHDLSARRAPVVSFGGVTYFLRALSDFHDLTADARALGVFERVLGKTLAQQGERGEWSWLYDIRTGRAVERYGVYSVHQEAMAMLFLLPAVARGIEGADEAIRRSYRWILGENDLGVPMWRDESFLVYRCIRRRLPVLSACGASRMSGLGRRADRLLNLAHAARGLVSGTSARPAPPDSLEINPECRSYEMGWTAYVWAGVDGYEEFTDVDSWPRVAALETAEHA